MTHDSEHPIKAPLTPKGSQQPTRASEDLEPAAVAISEHVQGSSMPPPFAAATTVAPTAPALAAKAAGEATRQLLQGKSKINFAASASAPAQQAPATRRGGGRRGSSGGGGGGEDTATPGRYAHKPRVRRVSIGSMLASSGSGSIVSSPRIERDDDQSPSVKVRGACAPLRKKTPTRRHSMFTFPTSSGSVSTSGCDSSDSSALPALPTVSD